MKVYRGSRSIAPPILNHCEWFLIAHSLVAVQTTVLQLIIYSILLPVCLLAMPVKAGASTAVQFQMHFSFSLLIFFFNYTSQPLFPIIPF